MLRSIKDITTYSIRAKDGEIGKAKDILFDDRDWNLRYLVADTGNWLPGRKVLISPLNLQKPDVGESPHLFPVALAKKQIKESPQLDEDAPVSRQFEAEYAKYYKHDFYWFNREAYEGKDRTSDPIAHSENLKEIRESHLRSTNELIGYHIKAEDGEFGHVEDFIIEDETWNLKYLVIDSRNWLPGKKFLIDINWIHDFQWSADSATVRLTQKQIEESPEYFPGEPINVDYLNRLYDYYGKPVPHVAESPLAPASTA